MLHLQLARSVDAFESQVRGRHDAVRASLRTDFAFIIGYWSVFAATSALFAMRGFRAADWLGAVAGELATIGALADVSENIYTLRLLLRIESTSGDDEPDSVARLMRLSSLFKWGSLFAAIGLLSVMFFERGGWNVILGVVYALPAAIGLATIAAEAGRLKIAEASLERLLRAGFVGNGIALLVGLPIAASQI
jgi:hypothetical protein